VTEAAVAIPKRALFKSAEVCEIVSVQPYVLRSWESEFPDLGVRKDGTTRVYRRSDVERVLRIKQLVFVDGLTLAGVRRRIKEDAPAAVEAEPPIEELLGRNARECLADVKRGLRAILEMLSNNGEATAWRPAAFAAAATPTPKARAKSPVRRSKPTRNARKGLAYGLAKRFPAKAKSSEIAPVARFPRKRRR
jgi:DNA-binding transcriptional MerR regulator